MKTQQSTRQTKEDLELYADILSHDILNNNQAVMSYLELIIATPGVDDKTKKYALKASSQTRMLSLMVEDVKKVASGMTGEPSTKREMKKLVERARDGVHNLFPDKKIALEIRISPSAASEKADEIVSDILVNLLMNVVQLDKAENPWIEVGVELPKAEGHKTWKLTVSDSNIALPPMFRKSPSGDVNRKDKSTAVRMSGFAFAKLASETVGGGVHGEEISRGKNPPGCRFTVSLPRSGGQ